MTAPLRLLDQAGALASAVLGESEQAVTATLQLLALARVVQELGLHWTLSLDEAARLFGVSVETFSAHAAEHGVRLQRWGRAVRVSALEVLWALAPQEWKATQAGGWPGCTDRKEHDYEDVHHNDTTWPGMPGRARRAPLAR